jgi:hypothetical protein
VGVGGERLVDVSISSLRTLPSFPLLQAFHLGGGGALMAFFLPFFKKVFEVPL